MLGTRPRKRPHREGPCMPQALSEGVPTEDRDRLSAEDENVLQHVFEEVNCLLGFLRRHNV